MVVKSWKRLPRREGFWVQVPALQQLSFSHLRLSYTWDNKSAFLKTHIFLANLWAWFVKFMANLWAWGVNSLPRLLYTWNNKSAFLKTHIFFGKSVCLVRQIYDKSVGLGRQQSLNTQGVIAVPKTHKFVPFLGVNFFYKFVGFGHIFYWSLRSCTHGVQKRVILKELILSYFLGFVCQIWYKLVGFWHIFFSLRVY